MSFGVQDERVVRGANAPHGETTGEARGDVPIVDAATKSYDFELPDELIAQQCVPQRDGSRLMWLDRSSDTVQHLTFKDIATLLHEDDILVLNNTRVIPARLRGSRKTGGKIEALLLARTGSVPADRGHVERWTALLTPSSRLKPGEQLPFEGGLLVIPERWERGFWHVRLESPQPVDKFLEDYGEVPLPPYIKRAVEKRHDPQDRERYQTVYAVHPGSAAAPTAGLHFSSDLLRELERKGVELHYLTLHVGLGTFSPVRAELVHEHRMHAERFSVDFSTWEAVRKARTEGRRVVAVGTTSIRTLESLASMSELPWSAEGVVTGETTLFIYPGYQFKIVDAIVTNFHVPRSSLLMLISAFAGRERVLSAYRTAVERRYRFFSYGDAMFIS